MIRSSGNIYVIKINHLKKSLFPLMSRNCFPIDIDLVIKKCDFPVK